MAGIYLHIPFCSTFCIYCGFYSVTKRELINNYLGALYEEIRFKKDFFKSIGVTPTTLYIGGGTPSLLSIEQLSGLIFSIKKQFEINSFEEFTIELNPDDVSSQYAEKLHEIGITRVSMGIQSFNNGHLKWMNRRHTAEQAEESFYSLRRAGFNNISLDLIFGYQSLSTDEWVNDIKKIIELHPEHISSYQMSIDENSALYKQYLRGKYIEPNSEQCAQQYTLLQNHLSKGGYIQYEISNFSLEGFASKHNSSYWEREPYLGLGASAHSFINNRRSWNVSDVEKYIDSGYLQPDGEEYLTQDEIDEEIIMLGLRKCSGIEIDKFPSIERAKRLIEEGLLENKKGRICIPPDKLFISDYIIPLAFK